MGTLLNKYNKALLALIALAVAALLTFSLSGCGNESDEGNSTTDEQTSQASLEELAIDMDAMDFEYTSREQDPSYDIEDATKVSFSGEEVIIDGEGADNDGSLVTISQAGTYILDGTSNDGQVKIDVNDNDKVQLVLNGVSLSNENEPVIYVMNADKTFITLADNTENTISDRNSEGYALEEGSDSEPDAVIFSHDDLAFNGNGTLTVSANYLDGIASKDDLIFCNNGTYNITAQDDCIRGKDSVKIQNGTFSLESTEGDGIKSTNDGASDKGYIVVDGGAFTITAGNKGIQAQTVAVINDGSINITAGNEGIESEQVYVNSGDVNIASQDDGINAAARDTIKEVLGISTDNDFEFKGSKVNREDMTPPNMEDGQELGDIPQKPEGNEGVTDDMPDVPDGKMMGKRDFDGQRGFNPNGDENTSGDDDMTPPDKPDNGQMPDDLQAPNSDRVDNKTFRDMKDNGNDEFDGNANDMGGKQGFAGKGGMGAMAGAYEDCLIEINGGNITVISVGSGDGIDSNGNIVINGGTLIVEGSSVGSESAMDYEYSAEVNGGIVLLVGQSQMTESFTGGEQAFIEQTVSGMNKTDSVAIEIRNSQDQLLISENVSGNFSNVIASCPEMNENDTYIIVVDNNAVSSEISVGSANAMPGKPGMARQ